MQKRDNSKPSMDKNERKRGRPSGRNRIPLSLEERRARNAQYERERRNETAVAMAELAEAACCDPQITNPELLATVINRLQQNNESESLDELKRLNENLELQIAALQSRLEIDPNYDDKYLDVQFDGKTISGTSSNSGSCDDRRPTKHRKTTKRNNVHHNSRRTSSSSHPEPNNDSMDSDWPNHHLGKTLPSQTLDQLNVLRTTSIQNQFYSDTTSTSSVKTESASLEYRQADTTQSQLKFENDFISECSELIAAFSEESNQQDVKVQIQLLPELSQNETEEQTGMSFLDPFTDGEKAILERLGWSDPVDSSFQEAYSDNQANIMWPVEYPEC